MGEAMDDKRIKVCIATMYGTENYGSNLQAIALSLALEKLGCNVFFLKKFRVWPYIIGHPALFFSRALNVFMKKRRRRFFSPVKYEISDERRKALSQFVKENYISKIYDNTGEWKKAIGEETVFVAGSDLIWNPYRGYPASYFLDFAYYAGLKRFSFASSVGTKTLPVKYHRAYRRYIGTMYSIAVREQNVADMLSEIIGRRVSRVADPVFLLTADEWAAFGEKASAEASVSGDYILCYFVMNDPGYWDYIRKVSEATVMQVVVLPMHDIDEKTPYKIIKTGTPYEFVKLIRDAEFICTDSYHATVLSLIFKKEFYLLRRKRKDEDDKFAEIIGRYGIDSRVVNRDKDFLRDKEIRYDEIYPIMEAERNSSMDYLKEALDI
ncbi:MAG: polysaccharide pyruvyl transferase family protein [Butyrivibrio sp.]|nr:polysaccharide pyruvyl transferase family protein [Butyrivibrio sp.]